MEIFFETMSLRFAAAVHILFKKWELRALGSSLAVNKQSWKTVELSFLHHDPALYSPMPGTATSAEHQEEQKRRPQERREPPPPVFDGSMDHKPLQLTLTSAALAALFNFVKLIDVWFVFMKGAARPTRLAYNKHQQPDLSSITSLYMQWRRQAPCTRWRICGK